MAVLGALNLTLADWAKRVGPDGNIDSIVELLAQQNDFAQDAVFKMANGPTSERVTVRTGMPDIYFRSINVGIPSSKSQTAQVDEPCAVMEARSEIDVLLAELNGNTAAFRLSEDIPFLEALAQKFVTTSFYGNPATDPKSFLGLSARYSTTTAGNAQNIIKAGGTTAGAQTSIWLINWHEQKVYCPFPKNTKAGVEHQDLKEQTIYSGDNRHQALVALYRMKVGLAVKDWRNAVRIPNVEVSHFSGLTITQSPTTYTNILHMMAQAIMRIPAGSKGKLRFYMNRTVASGLVRLAMEKSSAAMGLNMAAGQFGTDSESMLSYLNVPIRICDALLNTEAVVV